MGRLCSTALKTLDPTARLPAATAMPASLTWRRTGLEISAPCSTRGAQGIDVFMSATCSASHRRRQISGAFVYWRESGKFILFKCKAVVLATAAAANHGNHVELLEYTGDGVTMRWTWAPT